MTREEFLASIPYAGAGELYQQIESRWKVLQVRLEQKPIPKHLDGLEPGMALLKILGTPDIHAILGLGYKLAQEKSDPGLLLDALQDSLRIQILRLQVLAGFQDPGAYTLPLIQWAVWGDYQAIRDFLAPVVGMAAGGHRFNQTLHALLLGILFPHNQSISSILEMVSSYLSKKNAFFDEACVRFLQAVIQENLPEANQAFETLSRGYRKARFFHDFGSPALKWVGVLPLGLWSLGRLALGERSRELAKPKYEYLLWDLMDLHGPRKPFLPLAEPLAGLWERKSAYQLP